MKNKYFHKSKEVAEINERDLPEELFSDFDLSEAEAYLRYLKEKYDLKCEIFGERNQLINNQHHF